MYNEIASKVKADFSDAGTLTKWQTLQSGNTPARDTSYREAEYGF